MDRRAVMARPAPVDGDDARPAGSSRLADDRALYEEIGRRLRAHREALGVSQEWVAQRLGVSVPHYHRYERGARRIPLADFLVAVKALGQNAAALLAVEIKGLPADQVPDPADRPLELIVRDLERAMPVELEEVDVADFVGGQRKASVSTALGRQRWPYKRRPGEHAQRLVAVRVGPSAEAGLVDPSDVVVLNLDAMPFPGDLVLSSAGRWRRFLAEGDRLVMSNAAHGERPIGVARMRMARL